MPDTARAGEGALAYRPRPGRPARMMPWPAVQRAVDALAIQIRDAGTEPDAVIGIVAGGWIVAQCLADHFPGTPVLAAHARQDGGGLRAELASGQDGLLRTATLRPGAAVVLADEVIDSGRTAATFTAMLRRDHQLTVLTACLAASAAAEPAPDFAADRMDHLPELVLPWRVQRDFPQTIACLLRACPLNTEQIDERLRELGHDIHPYILDRRLGTLADAGLVTAGPTGQWGLAVRAS
ncbi:MAG: phosphoribosyltransferase family protein [Trebonia sp.]